MSPPARPAMSIARLLLCFSHLRWNFVQQRPQHLLTRASRTRQVLFVEEPVHEDGAVPRLDLHPQASGVIVCVPVLATGTTQAEAIVLQRGLIDDLLAERPADKLIAWYYTPMALAFSDHLAPDATVYDCMDELSAFRGAPASLVAEERRLFGRADLVFTGGRSLYEVKRTRHHSVHALPSSIDAPHFASARGRERKTTTPVLGWFGVIDERMDVDLVGRMADLRPDWRFVMVGPVVKIDPAVLPRRPNIDWAGPRSYQSLPDVLADWDVGLMPFALNDSTRCISPTKTPEFLAAGVPVVSTPIADVVSPYGDAGLVAIASDAEGFVRAAETLMTRHRGSWLERVDRHLAGMSWDRTWGAMDTLVADVLARRDEGTETAARSLPAFEGTSRV
jgi:glycosyltransferase involved in cell wall biosynthesis